jgi:hypothetical protein
MKIWKDILYVAVYQHILHKFTLNGFVVGIAT